MDARNDKDDIRPYQDWKWLQEFEDLTQEDISSCSCGHTPVLMELARCYWRIECHNHECKHFGESKSWRNEVWKAIDEWNENIRSDCNKSRECK